MASSDHKKRNVWLMESQIQQAFPSKDDAAATELIRLCQMDPATHREHPYLPHIKDAAQYLATVSDEQEQSGKTEKENGVTFQGEINQVSARGVVRILLIQIRKSGLGENNASNSDRVLPRWQVTDPELAKHTTEIVAEKTVAREKDPMYTAKQWQTGLARISAMCRRPAKKPSRRRRRPSPTTCRRSACPSARRPRPTSTKSRTAPKRRSLQARRTWPLQR